MDKKKQKKTEIKSPVYVTQPHLPPIDEFLPYLKTIWEKKWVTNSGNFHNEFEKALCRYLGVEFISLFANGTLALVTALQALRISGEVITTPYSFVATSHSLLWNNIRPVFVDIERDSFNINPEAVEQAITPNTSAILAVHCYGYPCNVDAIQNIADIYGLKVIYDAAHAFGVEYHTSSVLKHGDMSILSFHATKIFNTFEGGAIISRDLKTKQRIDYLKNFGFADEVTVVAPGINGKMNEFQAALGLLQLQYIDKSISRHREIAGVYKEALKNVKGIFVPPEPNSTRHNYSYFPIIVTDEYKSSRDDLYNRLKRYNIFSRRYFFPLISQFPMYRGLSSATPENLPVAIDISERILCLPIHTAVSENTVKRIIKIIKD